MKKYIAINGGSTSGIVTKEKAHEWARNQLAAQRVDKILIGEIIETVERTEPQIKVTSFFTQLDEPVLKSA